MADLEIAGFWDWKRLRQKSKNLKIPQFYSMAFFSFSLFSLSFRK
jgi:hypothetical protein